ncbi:MAG: hypothetical protein CL607_21650 [Anaerolineaceae bacterium]|nr:hypothetical protein [Anaerolineaceae bacterium]MCA9881990.1 hypothetical protein [Anaerolineae bacterium]MCA9889612.1 hypothetical protein [Anaerolineae bacterium]MCA9891432.1 hypothetical protein [Anaerolineae bacterium]
MTTQTMTSQTHEITTDLLGGLRQLVREVNRRDIRSVDALLSKLTGDANTALMLLRLIYWTPKSKRDGWVYKSWRDWDAECNLSQGQIKRVHGLALLEAVGVVREVRKANGVPTMHYRLEIGTFLRKIASYLGLELEYLETLFHVAIPDESDGSELPDSRGAVNPNDGAETAKPITGINQQSLHQSDTDNQTTTAGIHDPDQNSQDQNSLDLNNYDADDYDLYDDDVYDYALEKTNSVLLSLVDMGFSLSKSHWVVNRFDIDQIDSALTRARQAEAYNPPGFILTALQESWELPPGKLSLNDPKRYTRGKYSDFIDS